jgi:imidazolonepropionase-like amidohydrolase
MSLRVKAIFLVTLVAASGLYAQSGGKVTVVKAARMLDVRTGRVITNASVLIQDGRITEAGDKVSVPAGAEVIDLGDQTLLPGLIDAHTHLLQNYDNNLGGDDPNMILTVTQLGTTKRALLGAAMGREMLEAGFTAVRDVGNSGINGDVALRDAIRAGWVTGPRIVACTRALSASGGQFGHMTAEVQKLIEQEYVVISGVEEARRAVRQAFYDGADCIKVIVNTGPRVVSLEEMKVIVEEAHRVGKKVAAHAIGDNATRIAAEAGVDSIEHAYTVPDDVLKMMADKKIFLVPTDYPAEFYFDAFPPPPGASAEQIKEMSESAREFAESNHKRLARAVKANVRVAAGSDEYYQMPGKTRGQSSLLMFRAYAKSEMTPLQIIQSATINNAELLAGERAPFGAIEKGKYADIIAVPGDVLKDITVLERANFVMKAGVVVRNAASKK